VALDAPTFRAPWRQPICLRYVDVHVNAISVRHAIGFRHESRLLDAECVALGRAHSPLREVLLDVVIATGAHPKPGDRGEVPAQDTATGGYPLSPYRSGRLVPAAPSDRGNLTTRAGPLDVSLHVRDDNYQCFGRPLRSRSRVKGGVRSGS
jgi:hypothetical protein